MRSRESIFTRVPLPPCSLWRKPNARWARVGVNYMLGEKGNVAGVFTVPGFGFVGQGQNVGITFVRLKHWSKREGARNRASAIALRANGAFRKIAAGMEIGRAHV